MPSLWVSVLTELIPLALVVALSPVSIIPAVLVLGSPRPRPAGLAFLAGWLLGLAVLTGVFLELSNLIGGIGTKPPSWASWLRITVGAALLVYGAYKWVKRTTSAHMPGWMTRIGTLTPAKAGVTAAALTVINPKVLLICAAAGLAIGSAGVDTPAVWGAVLWFVLVAGSSVALPTLAYAVSGERLDPLLNRIRAWMERQHAALVAGILIVIGLLLLYKGIHALVG
ncbi:arginine exporter protein ArgO [Mycolicibacterium iranicum]|uniref:Arginine exporter protein ArgO n=1 Tax=Mycolicibacterium iranicum TaxID=912594 RepID=A0A839Q2N6_MYCIR|nr:GAP family protein [Mycolicibacterium iranicum]MBB2988585.1 arginine exporter protein ArgO [Mycolicibacterium iranicum]